jgi:hypothetical protein
LRTTALTCALFNAERVRELVSLLRSRSGSNPTTSVAWRWTLQIVKRSDTVQGFEVIPRRWVVERTLAWLGRCRRMAKDWEKTVASAEAWILIAHIRRVTRLLARAEHLIGNFESDSQI